MQLSIKDQVVEEIQNALERHTLEQVQAALSSCVTVQNGMKIMDLGKVEMSLGLTSGLFQRYLDLPDREVLMG